MNTGQLSNLPDLRSVFSQSKMKPCRADAVAKEMSHQAHVNQEAGGKPVRGIGLNLWLPFSLVGNEAARTIMQHGHSVMRQASGQPLMLIFRDVVISVRCTQRGAELRFVKNSEPDDINRDLPTIAQLAGDEWLDEHELERRKIPLSDLASTLLADRIRDIIAMVPYGTVHEIKAYREMKGIKDAYVYLDPYKTTSNWKFAQAASLYAAKLAGHSFSWELKSWRVHPSLASSWKMVPACCSMYLLNPARDLRTRIAC